MTDLVTSRGVSATSGTCRHCGEHVEEVERRWESTGGEPSCWQGDDLRPHEPRPIALDLFGCEGVIASGYERAGFDVLSVDNDPDRHQHNPYGWLLGDWREGLERALAIPRLVLAHSSAPCQGLTRGNVTRRDGAGVDQRWGTLIDAVRDAFVEQLPTGVAWIMENVEDAAKTGHLRPDVTLCGTMFGLTARDRDGALLHLTRHRVFESNVPLVAPEPHKPHRRTMLVGGVYSGGRRATKAETEGKTPAEVAALDRYAARVLRRGGYVPRDVEVQRELLRAPAYVTERGLQECVPPIYGQHLGAQVLARHDAREALREVEGVWA